MSNTFENMKAGLSIPAFVAPMFLVSTPEMVIEACKAGAVGTFPVMNARTVEALEDWMVRITSALEEAEEKTPGKIAPWAANIIVHRSNARFDDDLRLIQKYQPPIVITALGGPEKVIDAVHAYGGLVFSDVNSVAFAKKAVARGADGLILVAAGAGGHTGQMTGFSFVPAVREFFEGPLVLGGGIVDGKGIRAAEVLGADFAYLGTRFIATEESNANIAYRQMMIDATIDDIILSRYFTGIPAHYLLPSIVAMGIDPAELTKAKSQIDVDDKEAKAKAWRDIWSAGHGVGATKSVQKIADLVAELKSEYDAAG
jgi:nitronate monooxygenase